MAQRLQLPAKDDNVQIQEPLLPDEQSLLLYEILPFFTKNRLHDAAIIGDMELGMRLVTSQPHLALDRTKPGELTPMHIAGGAGHAEFVKMLVENMGIGIAMLGDDKDNTPLHYAIAKGKLEVIKSLIATNGQLVRCKNSSGENALHVAVKSRQVQVVEELLRSLPRSGAVDLIDTETNEGSTLLQLATSTGQSQIVELLKGQEFIITSDQQREETATLIRVTEEDSSRILVKTGTGLQETTQQRSDNQSLSLRRLFQKDPLFSSGEALRVVGSLVASVTFTVTVTPPSTLLRQGLKPKLSFSPKNTYHCNLVSSNIHCQELQLGQFLLLSTLSFLASIFLMIFSCSPFWAAQALHFSLLFLLSAHHTIINAFFTSNKNAWFAFTLYAILVLILVFRIFQPFFKDIIIRFRALHKKLLDLQRPTVSSS